MFYKKEANEVVTEFMDRCNSCELWDSNCLRRKCIENMFYDDKTLRICIYDCKHDTSPIPTDISECDF